jgi:hypothetical protein
LPLLLLLLQLTLPHPLSYLHQPLLQLLLLLLRQAPSLVQHTAAAAWA